MQVIGGGLVVVGHITATVKVPLVVLPQASCAVTVTVFVVLGRNVDGDGGLDVRVTLLHASVAMIVQLTTTLVQEYNTMLVETVREGGVLSTTVTVWVQVLLLVQQSVATQVRVMTVGHEPLVTVVREVMVTFVPQQASVAVGVSKDQTLPHCTVLLLPHVMTGGIVSTTVTCWVQIPRLLAQSVISQVSV